MSPLSVNDPQRGPPLSLPPCVVARPASPSPPFTLFFCHFSSFYLVQLTACPLFLHPPCLAHFPLPAAPLTHCAAHFSPPGQQQNLLFKTPPPPRAFYVVVGNFFGLVLTASHLQTMLSLSITADSSNGGQLSVGGWWGRFARTPSGAWYLQDADFHFGNTNYVCVFMLAHMSMSLFAGVTGVHLGVNSQTPRSTSAQHVGPPLHF